MEREPHLARFWRALGYRDDQLTVMDGAWMKKRFEIGYKGFFFIPISLWYLATGQANKIGPMYKMLITP